MTEEIRKAKVRDIISDKDQPTTLDIGTPLPKVAEALSKNPNHIVVIEENGKPKGVLTDDDIVNWIKDKAKGNIDLSKVTAKDLDPKPIIDIDGTDSLDTAIELFRRNPINKLLVKAQEGNVTGILTRIKAIEFMRTQQLKKL